MPKYQVIGLVDATVMEHVEADTPERAAEIAMDSMHASVCHQCADEIEIGDIIGCRVIADDGDGDEVYTDEAPNLHLTSVEQLEAELAKRRAADSD